jgi:hypothetical protein
VAAAKKPQGEPTKTMSTPTKISTRRCAARGRLRKISASSGLKIIV